MAYCTHCGGQVVDGATHCPHCHKPFSDQPHGHKPQAGSAKGSATPLWIAVAVGCGCLGLVVFTGIVSAILIPNFLDALQKAKQKRTMADIRIVGTAMMSWLSDEVGSAERGQDLPEKPTVEDLNRVLVPEYIQEVPAADGWGNPMEYWVNPNLLGSKVFRIHSAGRDGVFLPAARELQKQEAFLATDYDQDIVWADGYFLRYPAGQSR